MDSNQSDSQPRKVSKVEVSFISFMLGAACAGVAAFFLCWAKDESNKAHLQSEVHDPVRHVLNDVVETYDAKKPELAEMKVRTLDREWSDYLINGARKPELWREEIMRMKGVTTRPAK